MLYDAVARGEIPAGLLDLSLIPDVALGLNVLPGDDGRPVDPGLRPARAE